MMKHLIFLFAFFLYSCSSANTFSVEEVEIEAKSFMESYAKDLLAEDKPAILSRYSSEGAYLIFNEINVFRNHVDLESLYKNWEGPEEFTWEGLSYEVLGENAVVVTGYINWKGSVSPKPMKLSYTGLLIKENGEFKIRLEDEALNPFLFVSNFMDVDENPISQSLIEISIDPLLVKEAIQKAR